MNLKRLDKAHKWALGAAVVAAAGALGVGAWLALRARARALLAHRPTKDELDARSRMEGEGGPSPGALRAHAAPDAPAQTPEKAPEKA